MTHVKVFCRFRPQNALEIREGCVRVNAWKNVITKFKKNAWNQWHLRTFISRTHAYARGKGGESCITIDDTSRAVSLPGQRGPRTFVFDRIFDQDTKQQEVYDAVAKDLVESCIQGYNCSCFAVRQLTKDTVCACVFWTEFEANTHHSINLASNAALKLRNYQLINPVPLLILSASSNRWTYARFAVLFYILIPRYTVWTDRSGENVHHDGLFSILCWFA